MTLNLVFLKTSKSIASEEKSHLRRVILRHTKKAAGILRIKLLNFTVYFNKNVIAETGELGHASGGDWIRLTVDPTINRKKLNLIISNIIPSTIYHEMAHISRQKYLDYGDKLLETMISEGLATVFAEEQWPQFKAPWGRYTKKQIKKFIRLTKKEKNNKKYSHDVWFYGKGKPRWLGYKLGAFIIRSVKKHNSKLNAAKIMNMNAQKILKLGKIKF